MYDPSGFTGSAYLASNGTLVSIPYRVPAQGVLFFSADAGVTVIVMPVCALDDPQFTGWLCHTGIYRVEGPSGSVARIGQGKVMQRVRYHRTHAAFVPARLACAFGLNADWTEAERLYLEASIARNWVAEGNSLASPNFQNRLGALSQTRIRELDRISSTFEALNLLADDILDGGGEELVPVPLDDRLQVPHPPGGRAAGQHLMEHPFRKVVPIHHRIAQTYRAFAEGTLLRYEDAAASALAFVRSHDVVLLEGSAVWATVSARTTGRFAARHREFLHAAKVVVEGDTARTRAAVSAQSAAFLMRLVSGNRCHTGARWLPMGQYAS